VAPGPSALAFIVALGSLFAAAAAQARIKDIRIDAAEPFADGQSFGEAGPYLRIKGVAKGELDPKAPELADIVDLDKAPVNARGLVDYEVDFFILRPVTPTKGILFYEVLNRGNKQVGQRLHDLAGAAAALNDPRTRADAGNAFLFERGYSIVWSGWEADVAKANSTMGAGLPPALADGKPAVHRIREEMQVGKRVSAEVMTYRLSYPAASTDKSRGRLTARARASDARVEVPHEGWEFADDRSIRLLPRATPFTPTTIYELWYDAAGSKVAGIGFAATRDLVSFLRHERADDKGTSNPMLAAGEGVRHALAFGGSQSGRFLRHFIELGMNRDAQGRRVFDGMLAHTAGAGKVFANHPFSESDRTTTQHEDHDYPENWFPFSTASANDPFSGKSGALFRGDGFDPLLISTNSSTEYWQKGASLLTTDPSGARDLALPDGARVYMIAGTQHGGRAERRSASGVCANPANPVSHGPALRALVVALDEWVTKGVAPPESRVPSIAAGTAAEASAARMPAIKGVAPAPDANRIGPLGDWTDPPVTHTFYGTRVAAVDADGNEVAGIRLPDVAVPLATYTGWNVYKAAPSELCDRDGSAIPFTKTKTEREASGDSRPSLEERYGSRAAYVAKVKAAADALVAERLLLPADAAAYVRAAETSTGF
jgi:Alpha/beta hydrolase domain